MSSTPVVDKQFATADCHLVRVGRMGQVGRFRGFDFTRLRRGSRVVCRTPRGIEIGQVLNTAELPESAQDLADGRILRKLTPEDELLWSHLELLATQAHAHCQQFLRSAAHDDLLIDVEPLFDGKTLYFHFLSEVSSLVQKQLDALVDIYEHEVRESQFAKLLEHGCGPGCGTDKAERGCNATGGGCAVCKVASKCRPKDLGKNSSGI